MHSETRTRLSPKRGSLAVLFSESGLRRKQETRMQKFEELPIAGEIIESLKEFGFREMFPIQAAAILPLLNGRDVIGQAKTGTGKTTGLRIPMVQGIDRSLDAVQGLVLVPTRELAVQVASDLNGYGKHLSVRSLAVYGGQPIDGQMEALQSTIHIVVGTPGRIIDHLRRGTLLLDKASFVVLDEARFVEE